MLQYLAGIFAARAAGYGAKTILKRLGAKSPKWNHAVQAAEALGFTSPTILSRLARGKQGAAADPEEFMTLHEKTQRQHQKNKNKGYKQVAGAAGLAGIAAYGLNKYANRPEARGTTTVLPGRAPPEPQDIVGEEHKQLPHHPMGAQAQGAEVGGGPEMPSPFGNKPTQPRPPFTPEQQERQQTMEKLKGVAENLPTELEKQFPYLPIFVRTNIQAGKEPEEIYSQLQKSKMLSPVMQKIEEQTGVSYLERIRHLAGSNLNAVMGDEAKSAAKVPTPSETVITPMGAGDIHKVHNGNAYVEVNNKLHKIPLDELEQPPEAVIQAVSNILKIPEVDRSSNIALFSYDPHDESMIVQFHNGEIYKYLDIDRNKIEILANKMGIPITEGENIFGAWSPEDKKSLGAAFYQQILKDPKYAKARKGEPANPNWRKLETPYDYWEKLRKKSKRKK